jgi:hypothetical protein
MGWFDPIYCKAAPAQEVRALLTAHKQLVAEMRGIELRLRGRLRSFGLKVGEISKGQFAARVRTLTSGHPMLGKIAEAMLWLRQAAARRGMRRAKVVLVRKLVVILHRTWMNDATFHRAGKELPHY